MSNTTGGRIAGYRASAYGLAGWVKELHSACAVDLQSDRNRDRDTPFTMTANMGAFSLPDLCKPPSVHRERISSVQQREQAASANAVSELHGSLNLHGRPRVRHQPGGSDHGCSIPLCVDGRANHLVQVKERGRLATQLDYIIWVARSPIGIIAQEVFGVGGDAFFAVRLRKGSPSAFNV